MVVGAGIGGLTTAVALRRRGWDVTVLERAPSLEPVGAGIALAPNAVRALATTGVGDRVHELAALQGPVGIRRPDGDWLVRGDAAMADEAATVLLHRARLVSLLTDELPDASLRLGVEVVGVDPGGPDKPATVTTGAETWSADLVVAADGIDSPARAALFPDHPGPVYSGATAWRFVTDRPVIVQPAETWGAAPSSASRRSPTAGSTATSPRRCPNGHASTTSSASCDGGSPTGTIRCPRCSRPSGPTRSCITTCDGCAPRWPATTSSGWRSSGTRPTPCRRTWGRAAPRRSKMPWCWPPWWPMPGPSSSRRLWPPTRTVGATAPDGSRGPRRASAG